MDRLSVTKGMLGTDVICRSQKEAHSGVRVRILPRQGAWAHCFGKRILARRLIVALPWVHCHTMEHGIKVQLEAVYFEQSRQIFKEDIYFGNGRKSDLIVFWTQHGSLGLTMNKSLLWKINIRKKLGQKHRRQFHKMVQSHTHCILSFWKLDSWVQMWQESIIKTSNMYRCYSMEFVLQGKS